MVLAFVRGGHVFFLGSAVAIWRRYHIHLIFNILLFIYSIPPDSVPVDSGTIPVPIPE
jgi:hypothetical protein